jgi:hypothetical protein
MSRSPRDEYGPLFHIGDVPVHATSVIVALHVVAMIVMAIAPGLGGLLAYDSAALWKGGEWWRSVSWMAVHLPSLWFAWGMFVLYFFGREIEQFLGRTALVRLYGCLLIFTSAALVILGSLLPGQHAGTYLVHTGICVAFATIYPNASVFFNIPNKWLAGIIVGIGALQHLAARDWLGMIVLLGNVVLAWGFVRHERGELFVRTAAAESARPEPAPRITRTPPKTPPARELDVDAILDKISARGIQSLTDEERATLERASRRAAGRGHGA